METRHNTKLLEEAVALVVRRAEIPTKRAEAEAAARRRLATGIAIAVASVGIGLGLWFGLHPGEGRHVLAAEQFPLPTPTVTVTASPQVIPVPTVTVTATPTPVPMPSQAALTPSPVPSNPHLPILNYTKFASQKVYLFGREWDLESGHSFATETQTDWDAGWCYFMTSIGGITARIDLANRQHTYSTPIGPIASSDTFQRLGINDQQASELASRCPWLDGKVFSAYDLIPFTGRVSAPAAPTPEPIAPTPTQEATPSASATYTTSDGYDATGNDLPGMPLESASLEDCQSDCMQNFSCNAFTFNKRHNKCFLKSAARVLVPSNQAVTGYKSAAAGNMSPPVVSHLRVRNKSAVTGQWARGFVATSFDMCLVACEKDKSYCAGVNFDLTTSECNLFGSVSGNLTAPTMISGER